MSLDDATPAEWNLSHKAMYNGKPLNKTPQQTNLALDVQVGGQHYKDMVIQPAEFVIKNNIGFCEGNVIKYICRYKLKGGKEDLLKAKHYIDLLLENT